MSATAEDLFGSSSDSEEELLGAAKEAATTKKTPPAASAAASGKVAVFRAFVVLRVVITRVYYIICSRDRWFFDLPFGSMT